ncbi:MAG: alpha/beta hydrolase domain-containing protein [Actinomycetota bacterium]
MRTRLAMAVLTLAIVAAACGDDDGAGTTPSTTTTVDSTAELATPSSTTTAAPTVTEAPAPPPIAIGTVTPPPAESNGIVLPQPAVAAPAGYVVEEFFIGGSASSFAPIDTPADGFWTVAADAKAEYRTRVVVRRPAPEAFSGVVLVEWLNVTAVEASPDWAYLADEIGRSGHAYVAVSAQALGVEGGQSLLEVEIDEAVADDVGAEGDVATGGLVNTDPARYDTLTHPGDAFAFDIFSQVAATLRSDDTVLGGLEPRSVIAIGESQSAAFLTTYLNAIHADAAVYDGFLVHSRGAGAVPIEGRLVSDETDTSLVDDAILIRTDVDVPVFIVEAETDLTVLGYAAARQDDTAWIRTWEIAGVGHSDAHVIRAIIGGPRDGASTGALLGCATPINTGPHHEVLSAGLRHLVGWVDGGDPPPAATRIELTDDTPATIARDEIGHALGGVRNPLIDVPVVVNSGDPAPGLSIDEIGDFDICALFGQSTAIDRETLADLHDSADAYVAAFTASANDAVDAGFLLAEDAAELVAEAEANRALFG